MKNWSKIFKKNIFYNILFLEKKLYMKLQQYVDIEISSLKFQILTLRNIYCFR